MMQYRRFGRTELSMPVFSCGGMRYQQSWKDEELDQISTESQANVDGCVRRALELGINHIETARGYGTSEIQLGRILPALPREQLIVQTKVGPAPQEEFLRTFERSMSRLRLDYVDLLGLHGINNREILEKSLAKGGALDAARKLQREGRVRFIGFSTHGPCDVITDACATDAFDYVNLHWYWINQSNWPAIEEARRRDMGVFIISPNDKGGKLYEPSAKLAQLCQPWSPMIFNDLFCLLRPEIHTLSLGVAKPGDFDEHLRALDFLPKAETIVRTVEERMRGAMEEALGAEWCRNWEAGLPSWENTPGHVNVWEIFRLWTYAKALDMVEFGKMRYNLLGNGGHWFPGRNIAEADVSAVVAALKDSPFVARAAEILHEAHELLWDKPVERLSKSES